MNGKGQSGPDLMRRMARLVTVLVTMAYLLPALLTFMPSPASAAELAFYADLQKSRCLDMDGDGVPDTGDAANGSHDCCILCGPPPLPSPRPTADVPIDFAPLPARAVPAPRLVMGEPPSETVFRPLSQRGPPA